MADATLPFGEWRPDLALRDSEFAAEAENVLSGSNSYIPMPSPSPLSLDSISSGGNDSFTKILLHFEGANLGTTITDSASGLTHVWTAAGNAVTSSTSPKFGFSCLLLDGTGDWVSTPDSADYTLSTSNFTIEAQVNPTTSNILRYIAGQGDATGTVGSTAWLLYLNTSNKLEFKIGNGSAFTTVTGSATISTNVYTHVEVDRSGSAANNITLYVNGAVDAQGSFTGTALNSTQVLAVGAGGAITTTPWFGRIDEFRMSIGTARHTAAFTAPTVSYYAGGPCLGAVAVRTTTGGWRVIAGTATGLFSWSLSGWQEVTRATGGAYSVVERWSFAQFGDNIYACSGVNDVLQSMGITSGTVFAAAPGSPPQAAKVHTIAAFLVLSALTTNNRTIRWSGLEDPAQWTVGVNLCDEQTFPDGGQVMDILGDVNGYVLQDRSIRSMQFLPGDTTFIFAFNRVVNEKGTISRWGNGLVGNVLYFPAEDGFYALAGTQLVPIGHEKVNEWWIANSNATARNLVQCVTSNKPYVIWGYHSPAASGVYNKNLIYCWSNQRWSRGTLDVAAYVMAVSANLDLDTTGAGAGDSLADSSAPSLDSFAYVGGRPFLGMVNSAGQLCSWEGTPLAATLETTEARLVPGKRAFVSEVEPLIEAVGCTVAIGTRERLQDTVVYSSYTPLEVTGKASVLSSGRLHRASVKTQAGETWQHAQGVLIEAQPDGEA
jgi:hypothetical protein